MVNGNTVRVLDRLRGGGLAGLAREKVEVVGLGRCLFLANECVESAMPPVAGPRAAPVADADTTKGR